MFCALAWGLAPCIVAALRLTAGAAQSAPPIPASNAGPARSALPSASGPARSALPSASEPARSALPSASGPARSALPSASEPARSTPGSVVEIEHLQEPAAVAAGADGSIYVCESMADRVSVFDRSGKLQRRWGKPGSGPGQMQRPGGIAIGPEGNVYIADTGNHRVEVFTLAGLFLRSWGGFGSAPGEFIEPLGIATDAHRVYVADSRNNRIQVFDSEGRFLFYVWSYGVRDGQFDRPVGVAAASDGSFYVSDQGNSRIQKFDAEGRFLTTWGGWGRHPGLLAEPGGIDMVNDRLFVADTNNHRVQVFDPAGTPLGSWRNRPALESKGAALVGYPRDVSALPGGNGFAVCDSFLDRCAVVTNPPLEAASSSEPITSEARAAGGAGDELIVTTGGGSLLLLDLAVRGATPAAIFAGHGREPNELIRPSGIALDMRRATVLVSDAGSYRLASFRLAPLAGEPARFDSHRTRFVRSISLDDEEALLLWPGQWPLAPPLVEPGPLVRDAAGQILLIDTMHSRIVLFGADMKPVGSWGRRGSVDGAFLEPIDLCLDRTERTLYVLDAGRGRVQAFDRAGRLLFAWGKLGRGRSDFSRPVSLAAGSNGSVFVADRGANRILRFSSHGVFRGAWGVEGTARGQLYKPEKVFVDRKGRLIVIDAGGRRVQAFTEAGRFVWSLDVDKAARAAREQAPSEQAPSVQAPSEQALSEQAPSVQAPSEQIPSEQVPSAHTPRVDAAPAAPADPRAEECAPKVPSNDGHYLVCSRIEPDPVQLGEPFSIFVWVYEAAPPGQLAEMVALGVEAAMPEHGHGLVQLPRVKAVGAPIARERLPDHSLVHGAVGNGRFQVEGMRFHMPGRWEIYFDIGRGAGTERAQIELRLD